MQKFNFENFDTIFLDHINNSMREKAEILSKSEGITANYEEDKGILSVKFERGISEDLQQDKIGVLLKGGIVLDATGNKKNPYIIAPIGDKL